MGKHTPGPWTMSDGLDRITGGEVIKAGTTWIASVHDFNRADRDAERQANARLIAGAPALLKACRDLLADAEIRKGAYLHADLGAVYSAVIEAAGGERDETHRPTCDHPNAQR